MPQGRDDQPIRYVSEDEATQYGREGRPDNATPKSEAKQGPKIIPPQGGSGTASPQGQNHKPKK